VKPRSIITALAFVAGAIFVARIAYRVGERVGFRAGLRAALRALDSLP